MLKANDVGNTIRFKVDAKNRTAATRNVYADAVITAATGPTAAAHNRGRLSGWHRCGNIADIGSPALLLIDAQQTNPRSSAAERIS